MNRENGVAATDYTAHIIFYPLEHVAEDVNHILAVCDEKLDGYYGRLE